MAVFRSRESFYKAVSHPPPPHPPPLCGGICDIDCAHFIDYLKWRAIQPAIQRRAGALKDYK